MTQPMMTTIPLTETHVLVNRKGILAILEYNRFEEEWYEKMGKVGVSIDAGYGSPDLLDAVLDMLGFPPDDYDCESNPEGFCRDYLHDGPNYNSHEIPVTEYLNWLIKEKAEVDRITGSN